MKNKQLQEIEDKLRQEYGLPPKDRRKWYEKLYINAETVAYCFSWIITAGIGALIFILYMLLD